MLPGQLQLLRLVWSGLAQRVPSRPGYVQPAPPRVGFWLRGSRWPKGPPSQSTIPMSTEHSCASGRACGRGQRPLTWSCLGPGLLCRRASGMREQRRAPEAQRTSQTTPLPCSELTAEMESMPASRRCPAGPTTLLSPLLDSSSPYLPEASSFLPFSSSLIRCLILGRAF